MTDKELLELAAKAAGMKPVKWTDGKGGLWAYIKSGDYGSRLWNPLGDDALALRLAVKLGLTVEVLSKRMEPHTRVNGKEEEHRADPYAATRRAIVRAAAAIGETL